jgi:hypothetical protein
LIWPVVISYVVLAAAWIYLVLNTSRSDDSLQPNFWDSKSFLLLMGAIVVGTGFLIGRWWAPVLALVPAVLALPAGYEPDGYPEVPIWFYLGLQGLIFGVPLMAAGVAVRKAIYWVHRGSPCLRGRAWRA